MLYKHAKLIICLILLMLVVPLLIINSVQALVTGETFYPAEIKDFLNNPYIGWAPSAEGGPYAHPHRLVYINVTWRELEPEKGKYDFDALESKYKFDYWRSRDISIIFRMNMDFPGKEKHKDIPDWLFEEIKGDGTWYELDYGKGFSPNYSNPILILYHQKLVEALARRYNDDQLIPIIALGSIGHWGEWHTKQDHPAPIPFPSVNISNRYVEHYLKYFVNKQLVMRRPFAIALENRLGLYNDSFGNSIQTFDYFVDYIEKGYQDFLSGVAQPSMPDFWMFSSSGGEIAVPPGMNCFDENNIKATLEQIKACHTSWLGPSCPAYYPKDTEKQKNYDLALRTMGYRFMLYSVKHPRKIEAGSTLSMKMLWKNKGVAPFYYKWPLELSLSDSDSNIVSRISTPEDIRSWLPGETAVSTSLPIPANLKEGTYTLCVAIINPATGNPGIELAISGKRPDGRYSLDLVEVVHSH